MGETVQKVRQTVYGDGGGWPGRDNPKRRPFGSVVEPQIGLRPPGFSDQAAKGADEDGQANDQEKGAEQIETVTCLHQQGRMALGSGRCHAIFQIWPTR